MKDFITIATTRASRRAQKTYRMTDQGIKCEPYDSGMLITSERVDVDNLKQLASVVHELDLAPRSFVLRGEANDGEDPAKPHTRRYLARKNEGTGEVDTPPYKACDHHWLMLDVDDLSWPAYTTPECTGGYVEDGDGEAIAQHVLEQLPACFHGVEHIWHFSSSAGVKGWDTIKLHLWLWSDRPVCGISLREWLKVHAPCVDVAPFQPVQPHYTAAPAFEHMADPLLQGCARLGYVPGRALGLPARIVDLASYEAIETLHAARAKKAYANRQAANRDLHDKQGREAFALISLRKACACVMQAAVGTRHITLRDESLSIHRFVRDGELAWHDYYEGFMNAIRVTFPQKEWRTNERAVLGAARVEGGAA